MEEPGAEQQPGAETQPKPEQQSGAMEELGAEQQPGAETEPTTERQTRAETNAEAEQQPRPHEQPGAEQLPAAMSESEFQQFWCPWLASESDSEEEDEKLDQLWARREARPPIEPAELVGEAAAAADSGRQWQWQWQTGDSGRDGGRLETEAELDDEETWELAEPAVAEPAKPVQMSTDDDGMRGPKGPDAGHWLTAGHPLPLQGRGGDGQVARCGEAREDVERWVDKVCPNVGAKIWGPDRDQGSADERHVDERARYASHATPEWCCSERNTSRCTYMVNPCISLCPWGEL